MIRAHLAGPRGEQKQHSLHALTPHQPYFNSLLAASVVLLLLAGCSTTAPARPAVQLGEDGYLRVAAGGSVVPAAATADDLGEFVKASAMKDSIGIQEMSRQGRLVDIPGGTRVHVIDLAARLAVGMSRVRVLDGPLTGNAVWVLDNSLAAGTAPAAPAPQPTQQAPTPASTPALVAAPISSMDEAFTAAPPGWPNQPQGTAWYADGAYQLQTREAGHFVAIDAPLTSAFGDGVVSARFHKTGGPPGGGYGLIVADQGPDPHDGVNQGGRFVALEAGDQGLVGAWQREEDRWIDLQPWTPNAAVHEDVTVNELMVSVKGQQITFLVNGTQVAQVTTKLAAGRVGVFVGGDGNEVTLDRFTVQTTGATTLPASGSPASATPVVAPTPGTDVLLEQLDAAWTQGRWPEVFTLLNRIQQIAPTAVNFRDKRYAAHVEAAKALLAKGDPVSAVDELTKAKNMEPTRVEAYAVLLPPTPTATPAPATSRPRVTPEMQAYLVYMYARSSRIQSGLTSISTQSYKASVTPAVIFTDIWRLDTAVALTDLKMAGNDIQQYQPVPPEFKNLDDLFAACGKELVLFVTEYTLGVDNVSVARLNSASVHMESASARATQAAAEITRVAQQYDVPLDRSPSAVL